MKSAPPPIIYKRINVMKRYFWVVVTDHHNYEAIDREHANYLYEREEHARLERWDMALGTAKTIKTK